MSENMIGDLFWLIGISVFLICLTIVILAFLRAVTPHDSGDDEDD